ncbi:MAG: hypothetical protein ACE5MH_08265, partial [Terriglobia bacterium]
WFAYDTALALAIEEVPLRSDAQTGPHGGRPSGRAASGEFAPGGAAPAAGAPTDGVGNGQAGYKLELRSVEAAALLWNRLACDIEAYSFTHDADWHELVPLAHKEAAIRALTLVAAQEPGSGEPGAAFPLQAEQVVVVLEAVVAGRAYPRLVHTFRPPSAEDERGYRRLLAETLFVRGSRAPRTLIPTRLPRLVKFYDELILGVEGYTREGQPLASQEQAIQYMDAWHKRTAVQTLFGDASSGDSPELAANAIEEAAP